MNALARFFAALRAQPPQVPAPESPRYSSPAWWGLSNQIPTDLVLTIDQQLAVSVAWACVRAIVDPIAASELKVYQEVQGKRKEDRDGWMWWLMNMEPHPQYTAQGWIEVMLTRAVATGNAYAYLQPNGRSEIAAMQPLDPVRMLADDNGSGGVTYIYNDPTRGRVEMAEREVLHLRGPRTGGFYGDSAMARGAAAMALAKAQEQYATSYYANGAYPGVLLVPPPDMKAAPTRAEKQTLREVWKALFGGPRQANGMATLDPGWKMEVVETDAQKSQVVEARRFQVAEICRYFGVPGHLVGVPEAAQGYGKNLAELGIGFVRYTLEPWCRRIEEEFRRKLMPDRRASGAWFIEYDLERLKQGDAESVARAAEIDLRNGVLTINEARALRGLPSVEGGDMTTVNGKPIEALVAETAVAKLNAQPEIYQYHLEGGILTKNEVRKSLGLPPIPGGDVFTEPVQVKVDREQIKAVDKTKTDEPPDGEEDEDDPEDSGDGPERPDTADAAASVNTRPISEALDKHARRVRARSADLARAGKASDVGAHTAKLRTRARAEVLTLAPSLDRKAITTALISVEQGAPPDKAAAHLMGAA